MNIGNTGDTEQALRERETNTVKHKLDLIWKQPEGQYSGVVSCRGSRWPGFKSWLHYLPVKINKQKFI